MEAEPEFVDSLGERLLDARRIATFLGVSRHTVFRLAGTPNGIPAVKIGGARRFRPADVRAYLERRRVDNGDGGKASRLPSAAAINRAKAFAVAEGPPPDHK
jgi:excisionase family DNA binding protein